MSAFTVIEETFQGSPTRKSSKAKDNIKVSVKKFSSQTTLHSLNNITDKPSKTNFLNTKLSTSLNSTLTLNTELDKKSSNLLGLSPNKSNSHSKIKIEPSHQLPRQLWPKKIIKRDEIKEKPWYMLSFEEVIELNCGDERREEIYGVYNKSFVTKINSNDDVKKKIAFGTRTECSRFSQTKEEKIIEEEKKKKIVKNNSNQFSVSSINQLTPKKKKISEEEKLKSIQLKNKKAIENNIRSRKLNSSQLKNRIEKVQACIKKIQELEVHDRLYMKKIVNEQENHEIIVEEMNLKTYEMLENLKNNLKKIIDERDSKDENMKKLKSDIKKWENKKFNLNQIEHKQLYRDQVNYYENILMDVRFFFNLILSISFIFFSFNRS